MMHDIISHLLWHSPPKPYESLSSQNLQAAMLQAIQIPASVLGTKISRPALCSTPFPVPILTHLPSRTREHLLQLRTLFRRHPILQHLLGTIPHIILNISFQEDALSKRQPCQSNEILVRTTRNGAQFRFHVDEGRVEGGEVE